MGNGLPVGPVSPSVLTGTGSGSTSSPWSFVFENATSVYVADDSSIGTANVQQYIQRVAGGAWELINSLSIDTTASIYSIAGRVEAGDGFVLYAVTTSKLVRVRPLYGDVTLLATPGSSSRFRAVVLPPIQSGWLAASGTPTPSGTPSNSPTPSNTPSKTGTRTGESARHSERWGAPPPSCTYAHATHTLCPLPHTHLRRT